MSAVASAAEWLRGHARRLRPSPLILPSLPRAPIGEGFVSFGTSNYFPLLEVLVDSVQAFSKRPIVVFGINATPPFAGRPGVICRRMNVFGFWRGRVNLPDIFRLKCRVLLESRLRLGVYVDADSVVNRGIDVLFEHARSVEDTPLGPLHPNDPEDQAPLMKFLGVERKSMPYVHAHLVFSERCLPFLREWDRTCARYAGIAPAVDETLLNVLLWKRGATRFLPTYDPFFGAVEDYLARPDGPTAEGLGPLVFHGCKDPREARRILECLRAHAGR